MQETIIAWAIFVLLLLVGPIEPYGVVVRILYLIIIPLAVWYVLKHLGKGWNINSEMNERIQRLIFGMIAGVLFFGSYLSATSRYHIECTYSVQTRDGQECVGDYKSTNGPDWGGAVVLFGGGLVFIWLAVTNKKSEGD
jgi:hypothetical protein